MIKETLKKIHFVPYTPGKGKPKDDSDSPTLTIFADKNRFQFNKKAITEMDMNGKFIKFFFEPTKKIIGWKIEKSIDQRMMKEWKLVKMSKSGQYPVGIKNLLEIFRKQHKLQKEYRDLPIRKFRDNGLLSGPNNVYYYIELKAADEDVIEEDNV